MFEDQIRNYAKVVRGNYLAEVIASQNKMLDGPSEAAIDDHDGRGLPQSSRRGEDARAQPAELRDARAVLGGMLDETAMRAAVDAELYRKRRA